GSACTLPQLSIFCNSSPPHFVLEVTNLSLLALRQWRNTSMATAPKFRIDVDIHNLLMHASPEPVKAPAPKGLTLPEPIFPQYPEKLSDPGPSTPPEHRNWKWPEVYRKMRGWLFPYIRSRVLPGDFHTITSYLFVEYKCNLDCWYCWAYNNKVR